MSKLNSVLTSVHVAPRHLKLQVNDWFCDHVIWPAAICFGHSDEERCEMITNWCLIADLNVLWKSVSGGSLYLQLSPPEKLCPDPKAVGIESDWPRPLPPLLIRQFGAVETRSLVSAMAATPYLELYTRSKAGYRRFLAVLSWISFFLSEVSHRPIILCLMILFYKIILWLKVC